MYTLPPILYVYLSTVTEQSGQLIYPSIFQYILVVKRKPILLIDGSDDSRKAIDLLKHHDIEYVEYNIKKFEESCCGELPTTKAPSVFAVQGVFKGMEKINEYISLKSDPTSNIQSEGAYW